MLVCSNLSMKRKCPNQNCSYFKLPDLIKKDGTYFRKNDSRIIQRYKCKNCNRKFSSATGTLEFGQKKRRVNYPLYKILCSKVSQRRAAMILGISRHTVGKKLVYLAKKYRRENKKQLEKTTAVTCLVIDDLITKENSKLKPLSVSLAINGDTAEILKAEVSQIPAFGHLSKLAVKKYGKRPCFHRRGLRRLFEAIAPTIDPFSVVKSDEHKKYPEFVQRYLPDANHSTFKSERARVAGQGELKKGGFDPLFAVNHVCAMLRDNLNRLVRKTWCTTKEPVRLADHLEIFIHFHNNFLLPSRMKKKSMAPP